MDDDLQQLEAELKRLRPAAPSATLQARVRRELALAGAKRPANRRPAGWIWWLAALPAAAAVALIFARYTERKSRGGLAGPVARSPIEVAAPADGLLKPVAAQNVLYATDDEGLVTLDDGSPARRERLHFVDTITWRNPRTNASLRWSVPREEVRVVPVNFQ